VWAAIARAFVSRPGGAWFLGKKMAPANDIKAAKSTYEGFVNMVKVKWATPAICVLVFVVILVIQ
jgi:hypothetical protein